MAGILGPDFGISQNPVLQMDPTQQGMLQGGAGGVLGGTNPGVSLQKSYDNGLVKHFKIMQGDQHIGTVKTRSDYGNLIIDNIFAVGKSGAPLPPEQATNSLGPGVIRGVIGGLQQAFPNITSMTGNRVSGAVQGGQYTGVNGIPKFLNLPNP